MISDYDRIDVGGITHKDGVPWYESPRPRRWRHRHSPQTFSNVVERCSCGATRFTDENHDDTAWIEGRRPRFR